LVGQGNIGQKETAVLLVVVILGLMLIAGLGNGVRLKIVLKIEVHDVNKIVKIYIIYYEVIPLFYLYLTGFLIFT
jgi:hypothetical protein